MKIWEIILTSAGGIGGLWAIIWSVINLRPRKAIEKSAAQKANVEVSQLINAEWSKLYDKQEKWSAYQEKQIEDMQQEITRIKDQMNKGEVERKKFERILSKAYKCPIVQQVEDCIVVREDKKWRETK